MGITQSFLHETSRSSLYVVRVEISYVDINFIICICNWCLMPAAYNKWINSFLLFYIIVVKWLRYSGGCKFDTDFGFDHKNNAM